MPTVNEVIGGWLENAIQNPKTTISSILTAAIGLIPALMAGGIIQGHHMVTAEAVVVTCKVLLGAFIQTDPGRQKAVVPGQGVQTVDAHEVPDDPKAKPVIPTQAQK